MAKTVMYSLHVHSKVLSSLLRSMSITFFSSHSPFASSLKDQTCQGQSLQKIEHRSPAFWQLQALAFARDYV